MLLGSGGAYAAPYDGDYFGKKTLTSQACAESEFEYQQARIRNGEFIFTYDDEANEPVTFRQAIRGNTITEKWFLWNSWDKHTSVYGSTRASLSGQVNDNGIHLIFRAYRVGDIIGCKIDIYMVASPVGKEMEIDELEGVWEGRLAINPLYEPVEPVSRVQDVGNTKPDHGDIESRLRKLDELLDEGLISEDEAKQRRREILDEI
ncbi:MAG: SHOCT domain-containing protein [Rhodospirillales bacterium]